MRQEPPSIVYEEGLWWIVVRQLGVIYRFGPFDEPPQAEMTVYAFCDARGKAQQAVSVCHPVTLSPPHPITPSPRHPVMQPPR